MMSQTYLDSVQGRLAELYWSSVADYKPGYGQ